MTQIDQISWKSPAKLNLFLHIIGRRNDGYHNLQTLFQFLDFSDTLYFEPLEENNIKVEVPTLSISQDDNLIYKAAKLLKDSENITQGIAVKCDKIIPTGGGLGGGSSNAATTLLVLNKLWNLNLSEERLCELGQQLGADVPIFIHGVASISEGTGNVFYPAEPEETWYLIMVPDVSVSTSDIFNHPELPRNTKPLSLPLLETPSTNDCEQLVRRCYKEVDNLFEVLSKHGVPHLTGTGGCVFARFDSEQAALAIQNQLESPVQSFVAKGVNQSPLHTQLKR